MGGGESLSLSMLKEEEKQQNSVYNENYGRRERDNRVNMSEGKKRKKPQ